MLENQIKALAEVTAANTAAILQLVELLSVKGIIDTPKATSEPVVTNKPAISLDDTVEPIKADDTPVKKQSRTITEEKLKQLAKDKIANGVSRTAIKDLITAQGATSISKLNDDQLATVYEQLENLKGE